MDPIIDHWDSRDPIIDHWDSRDSIIDHWDSRDPIIDQWNSRDPKMRNYISIWQRLAVDLNGSHKVHFREH